MKHFLILIRPSYWYATTCRRIFLLFLIQRRDNKGNHIRKVKYVIRTSFSSKREVFIGVTKQSPWLNNMAVTPPVAVWGYPRRQRVSRNYAIANLEVGVLTKLPIFTPC